MTDFAWYLVFAVVAFPFALIVCMSNDNDNPVDSLTYGQLILALVVSLIPGIQLIFASCTAIVSVVGLLRILYTTRIFGNKINLKKD